MFRYVTHFPALCTRDTLGETLRSCRLYASCVDRSVITLRILIKRMGQADGNRRLYGVSLDYDTADLSISCSWGKVQFITGLQLESHFSLDRAVSSLRGASKASGIYSPIFGVRKLRWSYTLSELLISLNNCVVLLSVKEFKKSQNVYQSLRLPNHQYTKVSLCLQMLKVQVILTNKKKLSQNWTKRLIRKWLCKVVCCLQQLLWNSVFRRSRPRLGDTQTAKLDENERSRLD